MKNSPQGNAFSGFERQWESGIPDGVRRVTVTITMGFHTGIRSMKRPSD